MTHRRIADLARVSLCAALLAVCAWITIPAIIPFTLQTMGVALVLLLLGGKRGMAAIGLYLLLGVVGVPVFAGFRGGVGVLFGATGGYLLGFLAQAGVYGLISGREAPPWRRAVALAVGQLVCYTFGTLWFALLYSEQHGILWILANCVVPFILPDALKLTAAMFTAGRLERLIGKGEPV